MPERRNGIFQAKKLFYHFKKVFSFLAEDEISKNLVFIPKSCVTFITKTQLVFKSWPGIECIIKSENWKFG